MEITFFPDLGSNMFRWTQSPTSRFVPQDSTSVSYPVTFLCLRHDLSRRSIVCFVQVFAHVFENLYTDVEFSVKGRFLSSISARNRNFTQMPS